MLASVSAYSGTVAATAVSSISESFSSEGIVSFNRGVLSSRGDDNGAAAPVRAPVGSTSARAAISATAARKSRFSHASEG